jgi:hypothetical protein
MRLKSRVATEIARALDRRKLSVLAAAKEAGTTAADVSRIRKLISTVSRSIAWCGLRTGLAVEGQVGSADLVPRARDP